MRFIVKKCHPGPFQAVMCGMKPFEWRREDDVMFALGDTLILMEYRPLDCEDGPAGYTGREIRRVVSYVLRGEFDVPSGWAVLGLRNEGPQSR